MKLLLISLSALFLLFAPAGCGETDLLYGPDTKDAETPSITNPAQNMYGDITPEDFHSAFIELNERFGFYGLDDVVLDKEILASFSSLDEWQAYLMETWIPFMMYAADVQNLEANRIGFMPEHDITVLRFLEDDSISLYINQDAVPLHGRNIYRICAGNHDRVLLPLEPEFESAGIAFAWDEAANLLHIEGFASTISLEPGSVERYPANEIMLEKRTTGFYVHSDLFNALQRERYVDGFPEWRYMYQPWIPFIFHNLNKVTLVTDDRMNHAVYEHKRAMNYQLNVNIFQ